MSKKLNFTNPETKVPLSLNLDKEFIIVFGKNGAGKTTISRCAPNQNCVFNTDFIYRNIYIETSTGATDDSKTKEAFSELWIGEKTVKLKKELEEIRARSKEVTKIKDNLITVITKDFSDYGVTLINLNNVNIDLETIFATYKKPKDKTDEEIIKNYKSKNPLKTSINNEEELKQHIAKFHNNELVQIFINDLKNNALLNELFLINKKDEKDKFLEKIKRYNEIAKDLRHLDEVFTAKDTKKEEVWIKDALVLHEDADHCYFCGNPNIKEAMEKWKKVTESKLKEETNLIVDSLCNAKKSIENILKYKDSVLKIASKSVKSIDNLYAYLKDVEEKILTREPVDERMCFPDIKTDELITEENKLLEEIQKYIFKKYFDKYEITYLLLKDYLVQIANKDKEIEDEMDANAESITKAIDDHLRELDFDKELEIVVDKRGNEKKYRFGFASASVKLNTLSDGQKHKLALAIFFASIEKLDLTDKVVVLDDPVVTLDYRSYYSVKSKIIKLREEKKPLCLVLLTCNIDYLYIQLTNLFNKSEITDTTMFHLTGGSIEEVDFNIINFDDLSLYKNGLNQISSFEEFNLVASLNVRIYRMFLDLLLRMQGIPSNGNPKDEILSIPGIDKTTKDRLVEENEFVEKYCRKESATNSELFETFEKTNDFINTLGFPSLIDSTIFENLKKFNNSEIRSNAYSGNVLLFLIIRRALVIANSTEKKYKCLKDYLNHPRTQLTSSIVGVDFSDLEVDKIV